MEAYDHRALDASAKEIVDHAKRTNARVCGPVPIPTRVERYTGAAQPAYRQEVARAVRDAHAQARD
jgi:small subunit ribosomal protein S10